MGSSGFEGFMMYVPIRFCARPYSCGRVTMSLKLQSFVPVWASRAMRLPAPATRKMTSPSPLTSTSMKSSLHGQTTCEYLRRLAS